MSTKTAFTFEKSGIEAVNSGKCQLTVLKWIKTWPTREAIDPAGGSEVEKVACNDPYVPVPGVYDALTGEIAGSGSKTNHMNISLGVLHCVSQFITSTSEFALCETCCESPHICWRRKFSFLGNSVGHQT